MTGMHNVKNGGVLGVTALYAGSTDWFSTPCVHKKLAYRFSYGAALKDYFEAMNIIYESGMPFSNLISFYSIENAESAFAAAANAEYLKAMIKF